MKMLKTWVLLLVFGSLSSTLLSCNDEGIVDRITYNQYVFKNESGYDLQLKVYENGAIKSQPIIQQADSLVLEVEQDDESWKKFILFSDSIEILYQPAAGLRVYRATDLPYGARSLYNTDDAYTLTRQSGRPQNHYRYVFSPID